MNKACLQRKVLHINARILLLLPLWYSSSAGFKPEISHYRTPREAVEYVAWQALREGRPPCVTVHPIGISLFCIMGQCIHDTDGKPHCQCDRNFAGLTCSIYKGMCTSESICAPHLCKDNLAKSNKFECVCKPGYYVPDDPALSYCIPEKTLRSHTEVKANSLYIAARQSAKSPIDHSWQEDPSMSEPLRNENRGKFQATPKKNASEVGVLCASSDFLLCFIEPKEENKTALFKKALENVVAQRKMVPNTRVVSNCTRLENAQYPETQLSVMNDDDPHSNAQTSDKVEGYGVNIKKQPPTYSNPWQPTAATSSNKRNAIKGNGQSPFIIQRRFSSTFQMQPIGICNEILLPTDNVKSERKNAESMTETARQNNDYDESSVGYKMKNRSATEKSEPRDESIVSKLFRVSNKDDDYEVVQFRMRALQKESKFNKDKYKKGMYSALNHHLPAAYFLGAEVKKVIEKSHLGNKQLPVETQDQIIDNLRHAVDVSENTKTKVTNASHLVTYITTKLKSVVEVNEKGDDESNSLDEPHFRTDFNKKVLSTELEETSVTDISFNPSDATRHEMHNDNNSRTSSTEQLLSDTGRAGQKQETKAEVPLESNSIKGPINLEFQDSPRLKNGSNDPSHAMLSHVPLKDVGDPLLHLSGDEAKTEYWRPDTSTATGPNDEVPQSHKIKNKAQFEGLPANSIHTINTSNKRTHELEKVTPKLLGSAMSKHIRPQLFFNVTVLNQEGRNMSSAWYFVPAAGTKAILISWGVYNPNKT
ncbi:uncharacterized protein ISCGN_001199 [Ixodes scapularis]